jgi:hypothetical protein
MYGNLCNTKLMKGSNMLLHSSHIMWNTCIKYTLQYCSSKQILTKTYKINSMLIRGNLTSATIHATQYNQIESFFLFISFLCRVR